MEFLGYSLKKLGLLDFPAKSPDNLMPTYFKTGAYRDGSDNKLDYDGFLSFKVLETFAKYMHRHRKQSDGKMRESDNWKKGIDIKTYQKSLFRHTMQAKGVWEGIEVLDDKGERVELEEALCGIIFNAMGYLHELNRIQNGNSCKTWNKKRNRHQ